MLLPCKLFRGFGRAHLWEGRGVGLSTPLGVQGCYLQHCLPEGRSAWPTCPSRRGRMHNDNSSSCPGTGLITKANYQDRHADQPQGAPSAVPFVYTGHLMTVQVTDSLRKGTETGAGRGHRSKGTGASVAYWEQVAERRVFLLQVFLPECVQTVCVLTARGRTAWLAVPRAMTCSTSAPVPGAHRHSTSIRLL